MRTAPCGYAEVYRDLITGHKSDEIGRSNGSFVYVRGRLLNIEDERSQDIEHYLPAQVDDGPLDGFGVRYPIVTLKL